VNEAEWENIGLHHYDLLYPIDRALLKDKSEYDKLKNKSKQPIKKISKYKSKSSDLSSVVSDDSSSKPPSSKPPSSKPVTRSSSSKPVTRSSSSLPVHISDGSSSKPLSKKSSQSTSDKAKKSKSKSKSEQYYKSETTVEISESPVSDIIIPESSLHESKPKSVSKSKSKSVSKSKPKSVSKPVSKPVSKSVSESSYTQTPVKPKKPLKKTLKKQSISKPCNKFRMKTPKPGCAKVEGCIWIPGKNNGCFSEADAVIRKKELEKINPSQLPDKPKKPNNCKTFKKNKSKNNLAICKEQPGCKWVEKQGKKPGYCDNN